MPSNLVPPRFTDDQHRAMGKILGYPSCCVEEWIRDIKTSSVPLGILRGGHFIRHRSPEEVKEVEGKISFLLDRPWSMGSREMIYIPCFACKDYHDSQKEIKYG